MSFRKPFSLSLSLPDRAVDGESYRLRGDGHGGGQPQQHGHPVGPEHHLPIRLPNQVPAHAALHCEDLRRRL